MSIIEVEDEEKLKEKNVGSDLGPQIKFQCHIRYMKHCIGQAEYNEMSTVKSERSHNEEK